VTSNDIAVRIPADLGPTWPRNRPLPREVVAEICEALWQEGISPNRPHRAAANADMERSRIRPWHRGLAEGKDLCQLAQIRGQGVADLNPLLGEPLGL